VGLSTLDYVLVGFIVLVTLGGWRRGLIVTVFSILGSIAGAIIGHYLGTNFAAGSQATATRWAIEGLIFIIAVSLGNSVGAFVGKRINKALSWEPIQLVDHLSGGALSFAGWTLVIWIASTSIIASPLPKIPTALSNSKVVVTIDKYLPANVRNLVDDWRHMSSLSLNLQKTAD